MQFLELLLLFFCEIAILLRLSGWRRIWGDSEAGRRSGQLAGGECTVQHLARKTPKSCYLMHHSQIFMLPLLRLGFEGMDHGFVGKDQSLLWGWESSIPVVGDVNCSSVVCPVTINPRLYRTMNARGMTSLSNCARFAF